MLLFHATPRSNLASILRSGLLCARALGRRKVVWLHSRSFTGWALLHCRARHQDGRMALLRVRVPRSWLSRSGRRGRWICVRDIPTSRIEVIR